MVEAPQYILTDEYFQRLEPHHYVFEKREDGPVLALHRDSDNEYIGVHIPIEYAKGLAAYENLKMESYDQYLLDGWFEEQDNKPF